MIRPGAGDTFAGGFAGYLAGLEKEIIRICRSEEGGRLW